MATALYDRRTQSVKPVSLTAPAHFIQTRRGRRRGRLCRSRGRALCPRPGSLRPPPLLRHKVANSQGIFGVDTALTGRFFTYHRYMATDLTASQRLRTNRSKARGTSIGGIFRRLNASIEPIIRSGFASPGLLPAGLIVLETTGRRSGQTYRTPLLATLDPIGYLWISSVLGRSANWLRNAHANPAVRFWLGGRAREGHALVSAPGYPMPDLSDLPPLIRWKATRAVRISRVLGVGVVIIVPKAVDDHPSA